MPFKILNLASAVLQTQTNICAHTHFFFLYLLGFKLRVQYGRSNLPLTVLHVKLIFFNILCKAGTALLDRVIF